MNGNEILNLAREKHIKEREDNKELNAMRFVIQYQNGKTYIYKFVSATLSIFKTLKLEDVIMIQVASGISPVDNRNIFVPVIYNTVYIKERYEVPYDEN